MKNAKTALWLMAGMICALALFPDAAMAGGPNLGFDPPATDKSVSEFLMPMFGSLFGGAAGTPIEKVLGILNAAAMTVGGVLAAYTIIFGTMATAHDGEMMGRKWSSAWVPIRTALGVGLVVPLNSGFCVAQMIVAWAALQGVGIADKMWDAYATQYIEMENMSPLVKLPNVQALAQSTLTSQLCMAAYNRVQSVGQLIPNFQPMTARPMASGGGRTYGGGGLSADACGSVSYTFGATAEAAFATRNGLSGALAADAVALFGPEYGNQTLSAVQRAHIQAFADMEATMWILAAQIIAYRDTAGPAPDMTVYGKAIMKYQQSVTAATSGVVGSQDMLAQVKNAATQDGWIMAGAWFMKATQIQDFANRLVAAVPASSGLRQADFVSFGRDMQPYMNTGAALITRADSGVGAANMQAIGATGNTNSAFQQAFASLSDTVAGGVMAVFQLDGNRHPMMSLKDVGDHLMTGSEVGIISGIAMISAGAGVKAESDSWLGNAANVVTLGATSALAGAGSAGAATIGQLIIGFSLLLYGFGTAIAIYLPMVPFLIYVGVALGWLILVVESVIAAPLWAIMHLHPSGDEIAGKASQGYMLMLGLILRPALIIAGFVCALMMSQVVLSFVNSVFFPVFKMSMAGSIIGIGSLIGMVALYFGFMVYLLHQIFGLTHIVPDKVMRWMGGGVEQLGESGASAGRAGKAAAVGAVVAVAERGTSATAQGFASMGQQRQQRIGNEQAAQRAMSEKTSMLADSRAKAVTADSAAKEPGATAGEKFTAMSAKAKVGSMARQASLSAAQLGDKERSAQLNGEGQVAEGRASELLGEIQEMAQQATTHAETGAFANDAERAQAHKSAHKINALAEDASDSLAAHGLARPGDSAKYREAAAVHGELAKRLNAGETKNA